MTERNILIEKQKDGIAYIVISKPQRRNAIDASMMDDLTDALESLESDDEVKVIILKGQGNHFSSGGDLKAAPVGGYSIEGSRAALRKFCRVVQTIQQMDKPVIAMVKGYAVGGGMSLALACDLIFAAESARFSSNFLRVGITPEMGAMLFMPMTMGLYRAKELWFTGRMVTADEAREMGFVNKVFPDDTIEESTLAFAKELAQMPAMPVRITKRITNSIINNMLMAVLEAELQSTPFCTQTEEHKALISAFVNKSK